MKTLVFFLCLLLLQFVGVRADEPDTFCGRTVDGWIAVLGDRSSRERDRGRAAVMLGHPVETVGRAAPTMSAPPLVATRVTGG
jgi:hypothetical protein